MSKFEPTPAQRMAMKLSDHTMLVSAAAGSGKTAVLTKRIIRLITDTKKPVDVSEMLIVTFTKAAASELRERISAALYEALKTDPLNKHLSNQLMQLGKAKICTIHSFCSDLVKNNFQAVGLPANLRIADEAESALICNNIMNTLIDECYGGIYSECIIDFIDFTELFLQAKKDDILSASFTKIYNFLRNFPLGIDMLLVFADELTEGATLDPLATKWGLNIKKHIKMFFEHQYNFYCRACSHFENDELLSVKYLPSFEYDRDYCREFMEGIDYYTYNDVLDKLQSLKRVKLGRCNAEDLTEKDVYYKDTRSGFMEDLKKHVKSYFTFSEATVKKHMLRTAEVCRNMYGFLKLFDDRFKEEKKSRGLLDYSDLETYALKLLYADKECTVPNVLSQVLKDKYKYIFIDEYQDVNELQDKIFSGIATDTNRFMVGDIKQSIYSFRGAEPGLFSGYRSRFPSCEPALNPENDKCPDEDGVTLYLSNNFRSNKSVIDFSNGVFEVLFNNNSGKTPYTEGDKLVCTRLYEEGETDFNVRMCFVKDDNDDEETEENVSYDESAEDTQTLKSVQKEAEFVADEIEKLVNEGKDPSDIAILFRSRSNAVYFEDALKKRNIESFNSVDKDFFENDAVLLMLCVLNTVDNPGRDIYLTGTLKSPLFGFNLSEITEIRRFSQDGTLYSALKKYTKETNDKKCLYFLDKLEEWRKYAEGCPVDKLVRYIYNQTHIVELLAGKKNKDSDIERQANLLLLYEYARQFENGSFKGLYNFILYLDDVLAKRTKLSNARLTAEGKGVVNIMSVHNSKGLEFDTVFFSDTGHNFNRIDEREPYILHKEYGFSMKLRDSTYFGKFNTLPRNSAKLALREDSMDEEIRVLYVALTRAKKRLIITSSMKNAKKTIDEISSSDSVVSQYVLLESKCMSELLLWGILKSNYKDYDIEFIGDVEDKKIETDTSETIVSDDAEVKRLKNIVEGRLSFEYPYSGLIELPAKLAVSKLYPGVLDEYTTEVDTVAPTMYVCPKFMSDEPIAATGAEKGTATHMFMQFCDFENVKNKGVLSEIERLADKGFMDNRNAKLVNVEEAERFFKSDLFDSINKAKKIWRERRFNITLPASSFTENKELSEAYKNETILVQGVIDLLFLDENDNLVLLDYKTDRFSHKQKKDGEAEVVLIDRHKTQLSYYAEACRRMFGRAVDKILIYSFCLGKTVAIKE